MVLVKFIGWLSTCNNYVEMEIRSAVSQETYISFGQIKIYIYCYIFIKLYVPVERGYEFCRHPATPKSDDIIIMKLLPLLVRVIKRQVSLEVSEHNTHLLWMRSVFGDKV